MTIKMYNNLVTNSKFSYETTNSNASAVLGAGLACKPVSPGYSVPFPPLSVDSNNESTDSATKSTVVWTNPKPKIKNTLDLKVGDMVAIDGVECPATIRSVKSDGVTLRDHAESTKFDPSDVYKLYPGNRDYKIGDFVFDTDLKIWGVVTKTAPKDKKLHVATWAGSKTREYAVITKHYTRNAPIIDVNQYKCGSVLFGDTVYPSLSELRNVHPDAKFNAVKKRVTYEHAEIAAHFDVKEENLKPKDQTIAEQIDIALDHPFNVEAREWVMLVGPSGSGKTVAAVDYAKRKGRELVEIQCTAQLTVDDLKGYKSITTGEYFASLLRDAVENGKIVLLDEIDSANPNTLLALNGLKKDTYQFEDKKIAVHPEFRLIATANTLEYSEEYNGRQPLDKATRSRFKIINYDMEDYELAMRYGFKYIKQVDLTVSGQTPRDIERIVRGIRISEDIESWLIN